MAAAWSSLAAFNTFSGFVDDVIFPITAPRHDEPMQRGKGCTAGRVCNAIIVEIGEAIKNPAYRIFQTEYSGCLDISAHA